MCVQQLNRDKSNKMDWNFANCRIEIYQRFVGISACCNYVFQWFRRIHQNFDQTQTDAAATTSHENRIHNLCHKIIIFAMQIQ